MNAVFAITSCVLAIAWLPLAFRFKRGWTLRRNPVSLAICAAILLFVYMNVISSLVWMGSTTRDFGAVATRIFDAVVVINFYVAFYWSDKKFNEERRPNTYSIPPPNSSRTTLPS